MDEDIIHVNSNIAFVDQFAKDEVHHGLERSGGVREAEEHDHGFKEAVIRFESSFPLVPVSNAYIIVSPSDIQLREECRSATVHSCEAIHEFSYEW